MSRQGAPQQPTLENIKTFWDTEAAELGSTPQVTIRDHYFRVHELHALLGIIPRSASLLDIGCGTGLGTLALSRRASRVVGADYSPEMVAWAQRMLDDEEYRRELDQTFFPLAPLPAPTAAISFQQIDILNVPTVDVPFEVITGQRILINVPSHEHQMTALTQLRKVAAPGATLVLVEATKQGHARTDEFRKSFGLPPLEKYWHNKYVDEDAAADWKRAGWNLQSSLGFETYMLLSKVIYPAAVGPENCTFLSGTNQAAMEVACTARSAAAVAEVGLTGLLREFVQRVVKYDPSAAPLVEPWIAQHQKVLTLPNGLGHQRLFVARAV